MPAEITPEDVHAAVGVSNGMELMAAIRNSGSPLFQAHVPLPNADNVQAVGAGLTRLDVVQNEFVANLVDRIGKVVIKYKSFTNPLRMFKKGDFPLGRTIEEIWIDIATENKFDPAESVTGVFQRVIPDVKAMFHEINREGFYKQTIQHAWLEKAFTSWGQFDQFVAGVMNAIYAGDEIGEFEYMKLLIANYHEKELFHEVVVGEVNETNIRPFVRKLKGISNTLPFPSRKYNAQNVMQSTEKSKQYIIVDAMTDATIDTEVLASAFNMGKVEFLGHKVVIDEFPPTVDSDGTVTPSNLVAILVDSDWYMVYDKLYKMTNLFNPEGLYWNYWLHHHQLLSTSQFSNAIAFVKEATVPVTGVTVPQASYSLVKGETLTVPLTFAPAEATNKGGTVTSSNETVGTPTLTTNDGVVTEVNVLGVEVGQTLVTFTSTSGAKTATFLVTVTTE